MGYKKIKENLNFVNINLNIFNYTNYGIKLLKSAIWNIGRENQPPF